MVKKIYGVKELILCVYLYDGISDNKNRRKNNNRGVNVRTNRVSNRALEQCKSLMPKCDAYNTALDQFEFVAGSGSRLLALKRKTL